MKRKALLLFALLLSFTSGAWAQTSDMNEVPLTLEAIEDGTITFRNVVNRLYYRINGGELQEIAAFTYNSDTGEYIFTNTEIPVKAGDVVSFISDSGDFNNYGGTNWRYTFSYKNKSDAAKTAYSNINCTGDCYVYGNVMSLFSPNQFATLKTMNVKPGYSITGQTPWALAYLFWNNTHLKNHATKKLVLPATTLTDYCYFALFSGCSISEAPELPATTLKNSCYYGMFINCTNLTESPELPATTLVSGCYKQMFKNCTSLSKITCQATNISASECTANWVENVAPTGTFVKNSSMTSWTKGINGIPSSWTVIGPVEAYAAYDTDTKTLTFKYDNTRPKLSYVVPTDGTDPGWISNSNIYNYAEHVVFDDSFNAYHPTSCRRWFYRCKKLDNLTDWTNLNTSEVTNMDGMFAYCSGLTTIDLTGLDTHNVTNMESMFSGCSSLTSLDVSSLNTSKVTLFGAMFGQCQQLTTLDLHTFDTQQATDISYMFYRCYALKSVDLSSFNTSNVIDKGLTGLFSECSSLESVDIRHFDTQNATSFASMFYGCSSLKALDLSNFDTGKSTSFAWMFQNCSQLTCLDLTTFRTVGNPSYSFMFSGCTNLKSIYVDDAIWTPIDPMITTNNMFDYCYALVGEDGTHYTPTATDGTRAHTGAGGYFSKKYSTVTANESDGYYWTTYYKSTANRMADENTTVYTVSLDGTHITLNEVADRNIKAGQGALLKSTSPTITLANTIYEPTADFSKNAMTGTDAAITNPDYGNVYVLSKKSSGLGFYKLANGATIGAYKGYINTTAAARDFLPIEETTGVETMDNGKWRMDNGQWSMDNSVYDLQGRKVNGQLKKGIYIINGQKIVK